MNPPVLIVDSDGKTLAVFQRKLRKDYDAQIALGARMGLQRMNEDGPYAVVIAEYGMQPMDGLIFLSKVHENWPNTTRILISRITLETSVMLACINDAKIFHILPNPCPDEILAEVIGKAVALYEKNASQSEEIRKQLVRTAKAVHEIVSWLRSDVRELISSVLPILRELASRLRDPSPIVTETSLLLSTVGMISLPQNILQKLSCGENLSEQERALYCKHPEQAAEFFHHITQFGESLKLLRAYSEYLNTAVYKQQDAMQEPAVGAVLMAMLMEYRYACLHCSDLFEVMTLLGKSPLKFPKMYLRVLEDLVLSLDHSELQVSLADALPGMVVTRPVMAVRDGNDVELVPEGYEMSRTTLVFLRQSAKHSVIREPIYVRKPGSLAK